MVINAFWKGFKNCVNDQYLHILKIILEYSAKIKTSSRIAPRCFWDIMLSSNINKRCTCLKAFWVKITSWACLLGSGLKIFFYWKDKFLVFSRSAFGSLRRNFCHALWNVSTFNQQIISRSKASHFISY